MATTGRNVNDKVKFSNIDIDYPVQNFGSGDSGFAATNNSHLTVKANYQVDNSVKSGDQFTIQYGDTIRPGGLALPSTNTELRSNNGNLVATGVYDSSNNRTTYTFTNYVDQYDDISGSFEITAYPNKKNVVNDKGTYPMTVTLGNDRYTENVVVNYGNNKQGYLVGGTNYIDADGKNYHMVAYLNQVGATSPWTEITTKLNGFQFTGNKNDFKIYQVNDSRGFVDNFSPDFSNTRYYTDVTNNFTTTYNNDKTEATIKFGNTGNKKYIIAQNIPRTSQESNAKISYVYSYAQGNTLYSVSHDSSFTSNGDSSSASGNNANYSLGDTVWNDTNQDGIQNNGETGISGVYVTLKDSNGTELQRVTTDNSGKYQFNNLQNGDYKVEFSIPDGYTPSPTDQGGNDALDSDGVKDANRNIVVANGKINNANNMTVDTGFYVVPPKTYKIGNYVWKDSNDDGIQDSNESGIQGVTVKLTNNSTNETKTVQTDANGYYQFDGLSNGNYTVEFVAPQNMVDAKTNTTTSDKDSNPTRSTVTINNVDDMTIDKGYVPVYKIGDKVWNDVDKDGKQDAEEQGISNVSVELRKPNGEVIDRTTTDSNGNYLFSNVKNGTYTVVFQTPSGYTATLENAGNDRTIDSNGINASVTVNNADDLTIDSGFYKTPEPTKPKYNVGDRVWNDEDRNGIQDEGEKGIGGVKVLLKKDGRTIGSTATDRQGNYGFYDLEEGEYTIEFIDPNGYTASPKNAPGSTNANDSNGSTVRIELHNDDYTIDYGLYKGSQQDYEITVEDKSYENIVRENKALPKNTIQLVQQGKDGRDRVFYKELGYNPNLSGIEKDKLVSENGYYWQEVKRDTIYSSQDAIFEYNIDNGKVVKNITYNKGNNSYDVTYTDGSKETLPGTSGITIKETTTNDNGDIVIKFSDGNNVVIPQGKQGPQGDPGEKGEDGKSSKIETNPLIENGKEVGVTITITQPDGSKSVHKIYNGNDGEKGPQGDQGDKGAPGEPGKDGKSSIILTERGKDDQGKDGTWVKTYEVNPDGTRNQTDEKFIPDGKDGKDGKTPTVEQTPIKDENGKEIGTTIIVKDGNGKEVSRQDILNGKDGKDGNSVSTITTPGEKDGKTGSYIRTYETKEDGGLGKLINESFVYDGQNGRGITSETKRGKDDEGYDGSFIYIYELKPDGSKGDLISKSFVRDGKDGSNGSDGKDARPPKITQEPIKDNEGKQTGVTITITDADGNLISKENIFNGNDGKTPTIEQIPVKDENGKETGITIVKLFIMVKMAKMVKTEKMVNQ